MLGLIRRYGYLLFCFARYCLVREMSFRVNFLARAIAGMTWLAFLVAFFELIFLRTDRIGEWTRNEYLFFMGTGFLVNAFLETLFLPNCTNFAELIRTGDLDFALTKPVDEQFLLSLGRLDWAEVPSIFFGIGMLIYACIATGTPITIERVAGYSMLLTAGVAVMYSFLISMAASSVWIVRNRGLYEMWFYVTQFSRYPADIYQGGLMGNSLRIALLYVIPVMLAVNVPARFGIKATTWPMVCYLVTASFVLLSLSRWYFRYALSTYRSASS